MQDPKAPSLQSHFAPKTELRALKKEPGAPERAIPQKCKTRVPTLTRPAVARGLLRAAADRTAPSGLPRGKRPPSIPQPAIQQA